MPCLYPGAVIPIETDRLRLRLWSTEDLQPLSQIFSKKEVWHYPFRRAFTGQETEAFLQHRIAQQDRGLPTEWAAEDRKTAQLIGYIGLALPYWLPEIMPAVEVGWRLDPHHWGRGLATEGARVALDHGFGDLELEEIVSVYEPENRASGRVMDKLGMDFEREAVDPTHGLKLHIHRVTATQWAGAQVQQQRKRDRNGQRDLGQGDL